MDIEGFVRPLGNGFEEKIVIFETQVRGAVETDFHQDGVFGPDTDELIGGDLKELVVEAKGKVVGHDSFGADRQNFLESMRREP